LHDKIGNFQFHIWMIWMNFKTTNFHIWTISCTINCPSFVLFLVGYLEFLCIRNLCWPSLNCVCVWFCCISFLIVIGFIFFNSCRLGIVVKFLSKLWQRNYVSTSLKSYPRRSWCSWRVYIVKKVTIKKTIGKEA